MRRAQRQQGFTIVELLTVIAIIGVLMGIVTTAASSSVKMARVRKAEALCAVVQGGLAAYHARNDDEWPISGLENKTPTTSSNPNVYVLTGSEVRECVRKLVEEARKGQPVLDVAGLYVSRDQGEKTNKKNYGLDFMDAVRGTRESQKKMKVAEMYFGYPEKEHGWFRRFNMVYSLTADTLSVGQQD